MAWYPEIQLIKQEAVARVVGVDGTGERNRLTTKTEKKTIADAFNKSKKRKRREMQQ